MKDKKSKVGSLLAIGAVVGATVGAVVSAKKAKEKSRREMEQRTFIERDGKHIYFIGGGLASLAGAAYLIRDCNVEGNYIHIIEGMNILGGSNDGAGDISNGFVCRGGRMFNEETYENFWELFSSIPSLEVPGKSVTEEILNFDHLHPTHAQARLVDKDGKILDVTKMGFNTSDRLALAKLMATSEEKLDN